MERSLPNRIIKFSSPSPSPSFSLLRTRGSLSPRELAVPDQCYATVGEGFGECIIRGYGTDFSLPGRPFCQRITTSNSSSAWRELQANIMLSDQVHADVVSGVLVTGGVVSFFFFWEGGWLTKTHTVNTSDSLAPTMAAARPSSAMATYWDTPCQWLSTLSNPLLRPKLKQKVCRLICTLFLLHLAPKYLCKCIRSTSQDRIRYQGRSSGV